MDAMTVETKILCIDDIPAELQQKLTENPDHIVYEKSRIFILLNQTVFCCADTPEGNEMIYSIRMSQKIKTEFPNDTAAVIERILNDPYYIPDQAVQNKFRLIPFGKRCAVVFRTYLQQEKDLYRYFATIAPTEKNDLIVPVDYHTVLFIKNMQIESIEELAEYAEAVIGTMESEGITGIKAGVGNTAADISGIRNSYLEGCKALILGNRYHSQENVYIYSKQTLERIVDCIPTEKKKEIRDQFFSNENSGKLSDEMMETVRIFFRNDLNLTAASRQLFIHRNTLNYRLDKIKKECGLDLRLFQDAVVFRIVSEIQAEA